MKTFKIFFLFFLKFGLYVEAGIDLSKMSMEEKVGQILMVHFVGDKVNDDARFLVEDLHVGGIVYYNWANGLNSPTQVQSLSRSLQDLAMNGSNGVPLFIAADQEGGLVSRLQEGYTVFPGNRALKEAGDLSLVQPYFEVMGQELKRTGVNFNFAPVVDVNIQPNNPIIGIRSFGEDAKIVTDYAQKAVEGLKNAGVIATLKHFPGHGDVLKDSHYDFCSIEKSERELEQVELHPFRQLSKDVDVIMTAHLLVKALDPIYCSTLSKKTLDYLREKIGFTGVIITDSLTMDGVLKCGNSISQIAIDAFNAGADILLFGGKSLVGSNTPELRIDEIKKIRDDLLEAVQTGQISITKLDASVARILGLKDKYSLAETFNGSLTDPITSLDGIKLSEEIARKALKIKNAIDVKFDHKKIVVIAPQILKKSIDKTDFLSLDTGSSFFYFLGLKPTQNEILAIKELAQENDVLTIFSYGANQVPDQITLIQELQKLNKPTIVISTKDIQELEINGDQTIFYQTFSPTYVSIQAVYNHLMENIFK